MKGGIIAGIGAVVAIVIGIWLFFVVLKLTIKLIGLAIIVGLAAVAWIWLRNKFGGGDAR